MGVSSGDISDLHGILERVEIDNLMNRYDCAPVITQRKVIWYMKDLPAHVSYTASRKQKSIMEMWHGWDL
jgi:hypothetical protein